MSKDASDEPVILQLDPHFTVKHFGENLLVGNLHGFLKDLGSENMAGDSFKWTEKEITSPCFLPKVVK